MKNKLLVSVFVAAVAAFAFTSCKPKSDVKDVSTDLIKESLHSFARSMVSLRGEALTIAEYEFPSANVDDNRLIYRSIAFGNGKYEAKKVENLTYEYGEWNEDCTKFSLFVTPAKGEPYTLWFRSNAFLTPEGRVFDQLGTRVEKWEKSINTMTNTEWIATFMDELTVDSIIDTIYATILPPYIPPYKYKYDTVYYEDSVTILSADTMCTYEYIFNRDASTFANTGKFRRTSTRSTYDRETATTTIISKDVKEFDYNWFFSEVASNEKFTIVVKNIKTDDEKPLNISKYKLDSQDKASSFLLDGMTYVRTTAKP